MELQPERIEGRPYTIRSDVWSTGLSLLEFAQNRFPYPPDLGPIDLLQVIVRGPVPELDDDAEGGSRWSDKMKDFIKTWCVFAFLLRLCFFFFFCLFVFFAFRVGFVPLGFSFLLARSLLPLALAICLDFPRRSSRLVVFSRERAALHALFCSLRFCSRRVRDYLGIDVLPRRATSLYVTLPSEPNPIAKFKLCVRPWTWTSGSGEQLHSSRHASSSKDILTVSVPLDRAFDRRSNF